MGSFSIWHWLVVLAVVLLLFGGGGKLRNLGGDLAGMIRGFKKGMKEDGDKTLETNATDASSSSAAADKSESRDRSA